MVSEWEKSHRSGRVYRKTSVLIPVQNSFIRNGHFSYSDSLLIFLIRP